jgi:hypothetical protein
MTRKMFEVGVEGDLFNEHTENSACEAQGCVPTGRVDAEERIRMMEAAVTADTDDPIKLLYTTDKLVHDLIEIGAQLAGKYHHCSGCTCPAT